MLVLCCVRMSLLATLYWLLWLLCTSPMSALSVCLALISEILLFVSEQGAGQEEACGPR